MQTVPFHRHRRNQSSMKMVILQFAWTGFLLA